MDPTAYSKSILTALVFNGQQGHRTIIKEEGDNISVLGVGSTARNLDNSYTINVIDVCAKIDTFIKTNASTLQPHADLIEQYETYIHAKVIAIQSKSSGIIMWFILLWNRSLKKQLADECRAVRELESTVRDLKIRAFAMKDLNTRHTSTTGGVPLSGLTGSGAHAGILLPTDPSFTSNPSDVPSALPSSSAPSTLPPAPGLPPPPPPPPGLPPSPSSLLTPPAPKKRFPDEPNVVELRGTAQIANNDQFDQVCQYLEAMNLILGECLKEINPISLLLTAAERIQEKIRQCEQELKDIPSAIAPFNVDTEERYITVMMAVKKEVVPVQILSRAGYRELHPTQFPISSSSLEPANEMSHDLEPSSEGSEQPGETSQVEDSSEAMALSTPSTSSDSTLSNDAASHSFQLEDNLVAASGSIMADSSSASSSSPMNSSQDTDWDSDEEEDNENENGGQTESRRINNLGKVLLTGDVGTELTEEQKQSLTRRRLGLDQLSQGHVRSVISNSSANLTTFFSAKPQATNKVVLASRLAVFQSMPHLLDPSNLNSADTSGQSRVNVNIKSDETQAEEDLEIMNAPNFIDAFRTRMARLEEKIPRLKAQLTDIEAQIQSARATLTEKYQLDDVEAVYQEKAELVSRLKVKQKRYADRRQSSSSEVTSAPDASCSSSTDTIPTSPRELTTKEQIVDTYRDGFTSLPSEAKHALKLGIGAAKRNKDQKNFKNSLFAKFLPKKSD